MAATKKGGIFPWITNEAGTCSEPLSLSSIDFTTSQGDAFIGWGFVPQSVKDALYPKGYKGMLMGGSGKRAPVKKAPVRKAAPKPKKVVNKVVKKVVKKPLKGKK